MKNTLFLLSIVSLLALVVTGFNGCGPSVNVDNGGPSTLAGTSWKLVAFVNVEEKWSRAPDYGVHGQNERAYTLTFDTDSTAFGWTVVNTMGGRYSADYNSGHLLFWEIIGSHMGGDPDDVELYLLALDGSHRFKLYSQELHVFYNDGKEYLKFNRIGRIYED